MLKGYCDRCYAEFPSINKYKSAVCIPEFINQDGKIRMTSTDGFHLCDNCAEALLNFMGGMKTVSEARRNEHDSVL